MDAADIGPHLQHTSSGLNLRATVNCTAETSLDEAVPRFLEARDATAGSTGRVRGGIVGPFGAAEEHDEEGDASSSPMMPPLSQMGPVTPLLQGAAQPASAPTSLDLQDQYNAKGIEAFKAKNYEEAIGWFTKAIDVDPDIEAAVTLYSNRAASYTALSQFEKALADGENYIRVRPNSPRGHIRKAAALEGLAHERADEASKAYDDSLSTKPNNKQIKENIKEKIKTLREFRAGRATTTGGGADGVTAHDEPKPTTTDNNNNPKYNNNHNNHPVTTTPIPEPHKQELVQRPSKSLQAAATVAAATTTTTTTVAPTDKKTKNRKRNRDSAVNVVEVVNVDESEEEEEEAQGEGLFGRGAGLDASKVCDGADEEGGDDAVLQPLNHSKLLPQTDGVDEGSATVATVVEAEETPAAAAK